MDDLVNGFEELREDVLFEAEASSVFQQEAFFNLYAEVASENGDTIDLEYAHCRKDGGSAPYHIDGFAFDEDRGTFYLAVCDYNEERDLQSLDAARMESALKKATNFFKKAVEPSFINELEETSPAFAAAYPIYSHHRSIKRLRVILFSNARLSARRQPQLLEAIAGVQVVYSTLDLSRYTNILKSLSAPETIEVDLEAIAGHALPCLRASKMSSEYESYLLAIPGEVLADIYGLYGARLLEQNVRTYLQARTKVNKGILKTVRDEPEMFFAYNNGLTATASSVELELLGDGQLGISSINDLQIVNGGQTTASILYAKDVGKASLDRVHVQMKLSVVPAEFVGRVVPNISRFANTQNRISEADFFSNHPFHLQMERYSRLLQAPPQDGALHGDKWFYERARGQYRDGMAYSSQAGRNKYQLEYPRSKVFVKTDLAKYIVTFDGRPDIVSKGAQKCFMYFAEETSKAWNKQRLDFNETWFKTACSKALLFRHTDKMIAQSDWYQRDRGYKSATVPYALAWLANTVWSTHGKRLNWEVLWTSQDIPEELRDYLVQLAPQVAAAIKNTPDHVRNVLEYCKMQACWEEISRMEFNVPDLPDYLMMSDLEVQDEKKAARNTKKIDDDLDLNDVLLSIVPKAGLVLEIATQKKIISPKSSRALSKLERGNLDLLRPELNAMKNLIKQLAYHGIPIEEID